MSFALFIFLSISGLYIFIQIIFLPSRLASLTEQKRTCHFVTMKSPTETFSTLNRKSKSTCIQDRHQSIAAYNQGEMK